MIVSLFERDGSVILKLEDTGEGLSEEWRETAFEPSFNNYDEDSASFELAAVGGVIHIHGGHIELTSVMGKGNSYTITLPAVAPVQVATSMPEEFVPTQKTELPNIPSIAISEPRSEILADPGKSLPLPSKVLDKPGLKIDSALQVLPAVQEDVDEDSLDQLMKQLAELEKMSLAPAEENTSAPIAERSEPKIVAATDIQQLNFQGAEKSQESEDDFRFGLPAIPPQLKNQSSSPKPPPKMTDPEVDEFKVRVRKPRLRI
jgi:hypothetical protein